jgi:hypothetical protein
MPLDPSGFAYVFPSLADSFGAPPMPEDDDLRQRLLEALAPLLPRLIQPVVQPKTVQPQANAAPDHFKLRRIHQRLLAVAKPIPLPAKKLISLAGYSVNTYSRQAVTQLCRAGLLIRTADGISLPAGSQRPRP